MAEVYAYPPVGFRFRVTFDLLDNEKGIDTHFQQVSGISRELSIETYDEAGESRYTHQLPGKPKYGKLTLKRGMLTSSELIGWFRNAIENFEVEITTVTVSLQNNSDEDIAQWQFHQCWPQKWAIDAFNAQESQLVTESIDLVYSHFTRTK